VLPVPVITMLPDLLRGCLRDYDYTETKLIKNYMYTTIRKLKSVICIYTVC